MGLQKSGMSKQLSLHFTSSLHLINIKPVNPKENQHWIFIGRTDAEASIFWSPDTKSQLIGKDPNAGKYWGQEKGTAEDEMVGLHPWLNGHGFEQILGDSRGQRSLACCSLWGHKVLDTTYGLNNNHLAPTCTTLLASCVFIRGTWFHPLKKTEMSDTKRFLF